MRARAHSFRNCIIIDGREIPIRSVFVIKHCRRVQPDCDQSSTAARPGSSLIVRRAAWCSAEPPIEGLEDEPPELQSQLATDHSNCTGRGGTEKKQSAWFGDSTIATPSPIRRFVVKNQSNGIHSAPGGKQSPIHPISCPAGGHDSRQTLTTQS